jgi:hypothetical protein
MEVVMASGASSPGGQETGWNLEFKVSDWIKELFADMGDHMNETIERRRQELERRFDNVGWGLLFLLIAVLALPNGMTEYVAAAAVGAAMVGLNGLRVAAGVAVRWFSVFLGASFLLGGSGAAAGLHMDVFLLFFAMAGVVTIFGAIVGPRRATAQ